MHVTIHSDASLKEGRAGAAAWIRGDRGLIKLVRRFEADTIQFAEILIAYYAIRLAAYRWPETSSIHLRCDCKCVVDAINGNIEFSGGCRRDIELRIRSFCRASGIRVTASWIKGHQSPQKSTGAYVNNWCDRAAREARIGGR